MSLKDFTRKYTKEFFKDVKTLNIKRANHYPKATENVKDMIKFTETLEKKGYAYEKLHSVYFDISKFKDYGRLSRINLKENKPGARVDLDEYQKDASGDFTLLKRSKLDELKRGIFYQTKWGKVRPGWHLECSVMSMKYLGKTFDIHTGGVDLIFPHHENEIAQSEAYTGKKFVNFWLHNEHLLVDGKKMSKSLGNFYTLRDLLKRGYDWRAIRYFSISSHYRQKTNLTFKALKGTKKAIEKIKTFIEKISQKPKAKIPFRSQKSELIEDLILKAKSSFEKAMDDDLNTPEALAVIFYLIKEVKKIGELDSKTAKQVLNMIDKFDSVIGLRLLEKRREKNKTPEEIIKLLKERERLRKLKQWESADTVRLKIKQMGYLVEDTEEGPKIKKI